MSVKPTKKQKKPHTVTSLNHSLSIGNPVNLSGPDGMLRLTAASRQQRLAELIDAGNGITISTIAESYGVSTETIRRDLLQLEKSGRIHRVHGGALPAGRKAPVAMRMQEHGDEKRQIAKLVVPLLEADQWIFITSGSTTLEVARELSRGPTLSVLTNMPMIAEALHGPAKHRVSLTGGDYSYENGALEGQQVLDAIQECVFDTSIIGVFGLDVNHGMLEADKYYQRLKQKIVERSRKVIFVADQSKLGTTGNYCSIPFEKVGMLVTDVPPPPAIAEKLADAGATVIYPEQKQPVTELERDERGGGPRD